MDIFPYSVIKIVYFRLLLRYINFMKNRFEIMKTLIKRTPLFRIRNMNTDRLNPVIPLIYILIFNLNSSTLKFVVQSLLRLKSSRIYHILRDETTTNYSDPRLKPPNRFQQDFVHGYTILWNKISAVFTLKKALGMKPPPFWYFTGKNWISKCNQLLTVPY